MQNGTEGTTDILFLDSGIGISFLIFYVVIFVTSTIGNSTILVICYKTSSSPRGNGRAFQHSRGQFFNPYIANLAIADLLFTLLTLGDAAYALFDSWPMGTALCKLQGCLVETSYSASILTLIAISHERKNSVSGLQLQSQRQKSRERKITSAVVWLVAITLCSPLLYAYRIRKTLDNSILCENMVWGHLGRRVYYSVAATVLFMFPLVSMTWTYFKINREFRNHVSPTQSIQVSVRARQRKASRMLGVVTLVFFTLWTPFILLRTLMYFDLYHGHIMWKLSQLAIMASAATNPFVYSFYSTQFRNFIKRVITCRCVRSSTEESSQSGPFMTNSLV